MGNDPVDPEAGFPQTSWCTPEQLLHHGFWTSSYEVGAFLVTMPWPGDAWRMWNQWLPTPQKHALATASLQIWSCSPQRQGFLDCTNRVDMVSAHHCRTHLNHCCTARARSTNCGDADFLEAFSGQRGTLQAGKWFLGSAHEPLVHCGPGARSCIYRDLETTFHRKHTWAHCLHASMNLINIHLGAPLMVHPSKQTQRVQTQGQLCLSCQLKILRSLATQPYKAIRYVQSIKGPSVYKANFSRMG